MKQAERYIKDVTSGKEVACEFVKMAVSRHVEDLKKSKDKNYKFFFSLEQAQRALNFFRFLRHTSGALAGQKFNLQDNQAFQVAMLFGWRSKEDGTRRFTQGYIEEGRKGGKSQFAAGVEWYCGLCEGEEGAEVYTAATTRDQADMVFRAAKKMGRYLSQDSPSMKKSIDVMAHSIILKNTDSFIQKVSADAGTLDGLNPHCAVIDEYHAHKNDLVKGVMQTGMGARSNPLLLIITTAGFEKEAPCYKVERANAVAVLKGERRQDNLFAIIFTLDEGEAETVIALDPDKPKEAKEILRLARKSNPNLGSTPTEKYILDQVRDAKNKGASTRVQVMTKNFNCWMDAPKVWIPEEVVKSAMKPLDLSAFAGRECFVGIDLAATSDITALVLFFPPSGEVPAAVFPWFFLPEDTVKKRAADTNYLEWDEQGHLERTPGNVTDYSYLKKKLYSLAESVSEKCVAYDQWNAYQLAGELSGDGFEMVLCRQYYSYLSEPTKKIEKMLLSQFRHEQNGGTVGAGDDAAIHERMEISESPVMAWMFKNVALDYDANGNIKPNKEKSADKIDGVSALAMAVYAWLTSLSKPTVSSYLFGESALVINT